MQNHLYISSKTQFWSRNVRNLTKRRDLVMSGPAKEDKYLLQTSGNTFIFFRFYTFPFVINIFLFVENICFIKQIYILYKIIGFSREFITFIESSVLLSKFIIFIKAVILPREFIIFYDSICFT